MTPKIQITRPACRGTPGIRGAIPILLGLAAAIGGLAEDWPQSGGLDPGRNRYSATTGLAETFDPSELTLCQMYGSGARLAGDTTPFSELVMGACQNLKWVALLGSSSFESPTIAGGKVFIGTNNGVPRDSRHKGDRSLLQCFDERTGAFLWQLVVPKLKSGKVNEWEGLGLLSSPAVDSNRVYVATTRGEVLCLTTAGLGAGNVGPFIDEAQYTAGPDAAPIPSGPKDADIVWRYDLMGELGSYPHNGTRTDPLVLGDLVYLGTCNGVDWTHVNIPSPETPSLVALNKRTGELAGEDNAHISRRIFHGQWSSPSAGKVGGRWLILWGGGDGFCYAFEAAPVEENGQKLLKEVWRADCNPDGYKTRNGRPIKYPAADGPSEILATPVFWKNRVYVAIGQDPDRGEGQGNLVCLDATKTGDITKSGVLWHYQGLKRTLSSVSITPDGLLFAADFSGYVHCLDAETGLLYWRHDLKSHIWGSPLVADGKVYIGNEDGDFTILAANRRKKVLSVVELGDTIYSSAATANGVLYINSMNLLFAVEAGHPK